MQVFFLLVIINLCFPSFLFAWKGKVTKIINGDTFDVISENNETKKIHLYGISIPKDGGLYKKKAINFVNNISGSGWIDLIYLFDQNIEGRQNLRIIEPGYEILYMPSSDEILRLLELAGRTCYKSEDKIEDDSAADFVGRILRSGHESVIEHANVTVRFIIDRGVSHELVRHRLAAYSQESTRYANYGKDRFGRQITVIKPCFWDEDNPKYGMWEIAMQSAEQAYMHLLDQGASPQQARSVLPNSLKTEVVMTANLREWRHIFRLRCSKKAHPQIREVMLSLLYEMNKRIPVLFEDLEKEFL